MSGFPNVLGSIDGTHVQLIPPSETEHVFRNRKHTHSINVQVVCDSTTLITNVVAKYPGSVHDAFIFRNCSLFQRMRDGQYGDGWLLGDRAYPLHPWIMTPVQNPRSLAEERYNQAHCSTRNVIERTFGLLKSHFRVLDRTGGALLYSPEKVCQIVVACCMLHNIAVRAGMPVEAIEELMAEDEDPGQNPEPVQTGDGRQTRDLLIRTYFS
nr:putative nuclease HARBI1 [Misgurnus anguillicaudatus]